MKNLVCNVSAHSNKYPLLYWLHSCSVVHQTGDLSLVRTRFSLFLLTAGWIMPEQRPWMLLNSPHGSGRIQLWAVMGDSLFIYFPKKCKIVLSLAKPYLPYSENFLPWSLMELTLIKQCFPCWIGKKPSFIFPGFTMTETRKRDCSYFSNISLIQKSNHTFSFWNTIFFLLAHANCTLIFRRELTTAVSCCYVNKTVN